jgi:tol-pal system protein YbgF
MKTKVVAILVIALLLPMLNLAHGQLSNPNKLPPCPEPDLSKSTDKERIAKFTRCWGRYRVDGFIVEGEWPNGTLHRYGTSIAPDGTKFVGELKRGIPDGQGTVTIPEAGTYTGEWKDGVPNGRGKLTQPNGDRYTGEFKSGLYPGEGLLNLANGDHYRGEFKASRYHGRGSLSKADGSKLEVRWENGAFQDAKVVTETNDRNKRPEQEVNRNSEPKQDSPSADQKRSFDLALDAFRKGSFPEASNRFADLIKRFPDSTNLADAYYWLGASQYAMGSCTNAISAFNTVITRFATHQYAPEAMLTIASCQYEAQNKTAAKETLSNLIKYFPQSSAAEEAKKRFAQIDAVRASANKQSTKERQPPRLNLQVTNTEPTLDGSFTITVQTNTDTASLLINDEEQGGSPNGNYIVKKVARAGQATQFTITAIDINGNKDTKIFTVRRSIVESKVNYVALDPGRIKKQNARDAVAIIIGISDYRNLPKAAHADDDARAFYDYAIRALGVKPENIKLLVNQDADEIEIYKTFKTWLPSRVRPSTEVFVFYSGHGYTTPDGKGLYWFPYRADRDLISKSAILVEELSMDLLAANPKSVTVFADACYSGQARSGETLVASARPIMPRTEARVFPESFTVISGSQHDQISSASPDLQHGIFSYYLMRGMEGEADINRDGNITLGEMQTYLVENVGRQAAMMSRKQEPQLIGNANSVLVGR